jgi:hypothetical protein
MGERRMNLSDPTPGDMTTRDRAGVPTPAYGSGA